MQTPRKTLTTASFILTACLCFSQAKAPREPYAALYSESPLLIGKSMAWIVQEPRVISTGRVARILFGPGQNEAVVLSEPRRTITAEEAATAGISPVFTSTGEPPLVDFRVSLVNMAAGSSRQIAQFKAAGGYVSLEWASKGRLLEVRAGSAARVVDVQTGAAATLPEGSLLQRVESRIPHLALFREFSRERATSYSYALMDFSVRPPSFTALKLDGPASHPICLAEDGILVCQGGGIDLKSGQVKPLSGPKIDEYLKPPISQAQSIDIPWQTDRKGFSLVLIEGGERPRITISEEASGGQIDEREKWAVFEAHGAGFAVQLTPIDLDAARKALQEHGRRVAMSFGKQAGTAAHIYCADYDDLLPISGGQARDALAPYLKSSLILDSVIWTNITGQNLARMQDPAKTELGYVPGPGGRAIIYADGHVGWKAEP